MGLKFSQRIGKTPVRETLQVEGMDRGLENGLWNCIYTYLFKTQFNDQVKVYYKVHVDFFCEKINHFNEGASIQDGCKDNLRELEMKYESLLWYEKYDLIEFILQNSDAARLINSCNETLQKHQSAYRIINNQITPIISDLEIQTIETALENPSQAVTTHLDTALKYLSARQNPNYRNSVKEAISAVESYCLLLTNNSTTSLGKALELLEQKHGLHGVLKKAFKTLYGYTSTADGIRHALLEDNKPVTQAEARFMLIACSAFVNYLQDTVGE